MKVIIISSGKSVDKQLAELLKGQSQLMSKLTDFETNTKTSLDHTKMSLEAIGAGITALNKKVQDLQNTPGELGPSDQAAFDEIAADVAALSTRADALAGGFSEPAPAL